MLQEKSTAKTNKNDHRGAVRRFFISKKFVHYVTSPPVTRGRFVCLQAGGKFRSFGDEFCSLCAEASDLDLLERVSVGLFRGVQLRGGLNQLRVKILDDGRGVKLDDLGNSLDGPEALDRCGFVGLFDLVIEVATVKEEIVRPVVGL